MGIRVNWVLAERESERWQFKTEYLLIIDKTAVTAKVMTLLFLNQSNKKAP